MDIARLRYFSEVYENLNYSQAAQNAYVSRQALQQSVRSLERELGGALFETAGNRLLPTPLAHLLYRESREALAGFARLEEALADRSQTDTRPSIRQGTITNIHDIMSAKEAADCHRRNFDPRDAHVSGSCDELRALVAAGELDAAFLYGDMRFSRDFAAFAVRPRQTLWLAVPRSHALASRASVSAADLQNVAFLGMGAGYDIDKALAQRCGALGFELSVVQTSPSSESLLEKVAMGAGVTYRLNGALHRREVGTKVVCIPFDDPELQWDNYAIFCKEGLDENPAYRRFAG